MQPDTIAHHRPDKSLLKNRNWNKAYYTYTPMQGSAALPAATKEDCIMCAELMQPVAGRQHTREDLFMRVIRIAQGSNLADPLLSIYKFRDGSAEGSIHTTRLAGHEVPTPLTRRPPLPAGAPAAGLYGRREVDDGG
jgi:hypothetical protein